MAKKKKLFLILSAVVVVAAFVVLALVRNQEKLIPVTVETVEKGEIISLVTANGKVEAETKVNISADVMGRIVNLPVVEGDYVEKGQLLVEIDKTQKLTDVAQMRAALASAKVSEEEAQINYDRQAQFIQRKHISQAEFDMARTALDRAKAVVNQSQAGLNRALDQFNKCTIKAPMTGTITTLNSEEGENVIIGTMNNLGTVIMVISDLSEIVVKADVDETDIARLALEQGVEIALDAFPDTTFKGMITEIGNAAKISGSFQNEVTNFEVTILITDDVEGIKPGMNATVDITTNTREDVIKIPIQAVVMRKPVEEEKTEDETTEGAVASQSEDEETSDKDKSKEEEEEIDGVFIEDNQEVKFAPVVTGVADQQYIEIETGLEVDQIIVTGSYKTLRSLEHGDKVKPKEKTEDESESE
ncbi:MAG: efflux RND transporter periplasmic adaptor subunit [candidate division Zixibacteria bacterium]|nr:efflux RND transporter periplasmic adaptor subunit [candidate division Zixibacteria bacterium]